MANNWKFSAAVLSKVEEVPGFDGDQAYTLAWYGTGTTADLASRWASQTGAFLFIKAAYSTIDNDVFKGKLANYLNAPLRGNISLLWLENPLASLADWQTNSISTLANGNRVEVSQLAYLDIRNYSFSIAARTTVAFNSAKLEFHRSGQNPQAFELATNFGHYRLYDIPDVVNLPMQGAQAGCIEFNLKVKKEVDDHLGTYGYPALAKLDLSIRLFMRDPDFPESGDNFYVSSHRYPFFTEQSDYALGESYYRDSIDFQVSLDFLYPQHPDRSFFGLQIIVDDDPTVDTFRDLGYPTGFRTNLGYTAHIIPTATSKFVFATRPNKLLSEDQAAAFYLTPSGAFNLRVPRYHTDLSVDVNHEDSLICGISGVEYIKISGDTGSVLHCIADQPAYLPNYVSVEALMRDLGTILESYSSRTLPANTTDLDMLIEDKQEGEANEAMGITDDEREEILNIIRLDYFPPGYQFTEKAIAEYMNLEIVEELIEWLRTTLQAATLADGADGNILTTAATTAWIYVTDPEGAVYYAQPDQAILYKAEKSSTQFLDFMEVPSVGLPASLTTSQEADLLQKSNTNALAFPMLPYGFVDSQKLTDLRQLEIQLISNFRRDRIQSISAVSNNITPLVPVGTESSEEEIIYQGATPQGLLASYPKNFMQIQELMIAKDTENEEVKLVNIEHGSALKASLQSNQLFMVASDPDSLKDYFSTAELDLYIQAATAQGKTVKATNRLTIGEWIFELGPYGQEEETSGEAIKHWDKNGTIVIFKFHDKPLIELVDDPSMWSFAGEFNENQAKTSRTLKRLLTEAIESGKSADPKERRKYEVLARAATYAGWSGILAFNVDIPLGNLPDSLKALAAGIDKDKFFSQYVGIEVTQIHSTGTALVPQQSSLFGLIDYNNNNIPLADESGYNFHVRFLTVIFQNSQIVDFAAEVLLILDKLFDEPTQLLNSTNGRNILRLKGVAEEHNGKTTYSFGFSGANRFQLSGKVIQEVEIVKAQFATDPIGAAVNNKLAIKGRFSLWGRMRFAYLEGLDILSFGAYPQQEIAGAPQPTDQAGEPDYLNMSNLQVVMAFDLHEVTGDVSNKTFSFNPNQVAYDLKRSGWRKHSLYEKFPLKFKTLRYVKNDANALANSGFMPVRSGLQSTLTKDDIGSNWYGLVFDLNMGSIGSLAGGAGLNVGVMAAWKPGKEGLYIGLKLPGSSGGKKEISIQGVLKIAFKHIQFVSYPIVAKEVEDMTPEERQQVGYLLKLKNIVIKFFVVSFPPVGKTEIILFGDPREEVEREDKLVGWYAAYTK
ncbi:hypothetical protein [Lewinella cohaerens]|uniref:hypothetical protein n=1 Tax=Lewinella cohaerens TaxID=70995 RepID=UPI000365830E|nr:hypothetical protein [Lewinella cohaerens]